ncbi:MAG: PhnD/SsuA/transferrin family substrate-binding protein [Parvibaculaceae bacterium]
MKRYWLSFLMLAFAALATLPAAAAEKIRLAITDVDGLEALQRDFGAFRDALAKESGLEVEFFPVSGRTAAVEAMAADQVDFVLTGPAEYVVFNARLKAQPVVSWVRPDYYPQVVSLEAANIKTPADLKGKKISLGEIGSTSQHLVPATILAEDGLVYSTDYEPVFLKLNAAAEAMISGDIAAIGMNRTHLDRITEKFPTQKFHVIRKGPELPNDVLLASDKVKPETIAIVRKTFAEKGPALIAAITAAEENAKYIGGSFVPDVTDANYDVVRKMYTNVGISEFTQFIGN